MCKKHFEAIAAAFRSYDFSDPQDRTSFACRLADVFIKFNPRFDRERFLRACGID